MVLPKEGCLLRVFIGESDKHEGRPLYEWLVQRAREHGLAGATVLRGIEGFGAHSRVHTAKILQLSTDLPIVVDIVDSREKIETFWPVVDGTISEGLATLARVEIRFYRSGGKTSIALRKRREDKPFTPGQVWPRFDEIFQRKPFVSPRRHFGRQFSIRINLVAFNAKLVTGRRMIADVENHKIENDQRYVLRRHGKGQLNGSDKIFDGYRSLRLFCHPVYVF